MTFDSSDMVMDVNAMSHYCQSTYAFHRTAVSHHNANMHSRNDAQAERLARKVQSLCESIAAKYPEFAKDDGTINHNRIAEHISEKLKLPFPQSTLTRILNGKVSNPSSQTLRTLSAYFGVPVAELRDEESPKAAAPLSAEHRDLLEKWNELPAPVQRYFLQQMDAILHLTERFPTFVHAMFSAPDKKREREHWKIMEAYDAEYRAKIGD